MTDNWRETLPEPLREAPIFKNAESIEKAIEDISGLTQWRGNSLRIPGPDSSPEQIKEYQQRVMEKIPGLMVVPDPDAEDFGKVFEKLGKPQNPEKYKIPEGVDLTPEQVAGLKTQAHNNNMTQAQFANMVKAQWDQAKEAFESQEGFYREQDGIIKGEWGVAAKERLDAINRFLAGEEKAPQSLKEAFANGRVSAEDARFWYDVVTRMEEGSEISGQVSERTGVTPLEAMERVNELTARLTKKGAAAEPNYRKLVDERVRYMRLANGQES